MRQLCMKIILWYDLFGLVSCKNMVLVPIKKSDFLKNLNETKTKTDIFAELKPYCSQNINMM